MNHYRFRLILATASLTAALTVLALKGGGFISHPGDGGIMLTVSNRYSGQDISRYRLDCTQQFARLESREQAGSAALWLLDPQGHIVSCKRGDQVGLANP